MEMSKTQFALYFLISALIIVFLSFGMIQTFEAPDKAQEYEGIYYRQFEHHAFIPCGAKESWWVNSNIDYELKMKYMSVKLPDKDFIYLKVIGEISELGHYGHLGMSDRDLFINEIIAAKPREPKDCFNIE